MIALLISYYTGDGTYDGYGSLAIGIILLCVAIFLARELKPLLIGESADESNIKVVHDVVDSIPNIKEIINCVSIQQGPGEVLMCIKIVCDENLKTMELCNLINDFELQIRAKSPEIKWLFIEPDIRRK